jgi:pyridoxine kinase
MRNIKKVAAIQDMSGLGRCSLTVIIPVLSAMGIQVCPVPTAVLSAHTGYGEFVMHDLTDFMVPVLEHYKKLKVDFDCIYSGFLASAEQIDHCLEFFRAFPDSLKLVDPVMGDDGRAYATYTKELCDRMSELVAVADIITPNLTEAAILLGEQYPKNAVSLDLIKKWLVRLSEMGAGIVVITSVMLEDGNMATVGYNKADGSFWRLNSKIVPAHYSGTGDMFASVLIGSILKGDDLAVAMNRAGDFTEHSVRVTYRCKRPWTEGLMFEGELSMLSSEMSCDRCEKM